jgi:AcrR family transcriptional regulator
VSIRKRLTRVEAAELTGTRLLNAAREAFTQQGYHATTLDAVAAAAGFTKGVVYARYASKADLFLALVEERIDRRIRDMERLEVPDLLDALLRQQMARLEGERSWLLVVTEFRIAASRVPALAARYAALHERLVQAVAAAIVRALEREGRELAMPAVDFARVALALGGGMMLERVTSGPVFSDALAQRTHRVLVEAVSQPIERRSRSTRKTRGSKMR